MRVNYPRAEDPWAAFIPPAEDGGVSPLLLNNVGADTHRYFLNGTEPMLRLSTFYSDVLQTTLIGVSTSDGDAVIASDTVLSAVGKLQAQIDLTAPKADPVFTGTVTIPAGTIDGAIIGQTTPAAATFTTVTITSLPTNPTGLPTGTVWLNNGALYVA
jgi:hypothetical protein